MSAQVFMITRAAPGASAEVLVAQGQGPGGAPDDALEVVEHPGLRARPVMRGTTEALVIELPNGDRFAFIIDKGAREGGVALEAGETQLRGCASAATVVRLRASGDIEVTPADGRSVILARGGAHVAREGDAVSAGGGLNGMASWITSVTAAINALAGPGTVTPPTNFGEVAEGAEHVLA